ncbi:MAG: VCBS repeat-containing protein [Pyrinomonadaceae bacterium]
MFTTAILKTITPRLIAAILTGLFTTVALAHSGDTTLKNDAVLAPINDNFSAAQLLSGISGVATGTNAGAGKEGGEPVHGRNRGGASVWYKYVAQGNGVMTIDTASSGFDTVVAVYKGTGFGDFKPIATNDDAAGSTRAKVTFGIQLNDVFYIAVDGYYSNTSGTTSSGSIQLAYTFSNVADNDNFANPRLISLSGEKLITTSNNGASLESGEPTIFGEPGGKSLWFKWTSPANAGRSYTITVENSNLAGTGSPQVFWGLYTGTNFNNLAVTSYGAYTKYFQVTWKPASSTTYYFTVDGYDSGSGVTPADFTLSLGVAKDNKTADFDKDGRTDIAVFRPSTGTWYSIDSIIDQVRSVQFGALGDKPVLGDLGGNFTHDGIPDYTVFRPDTGAWYVKNSEVGFQAYLWGVGGDIPLMDNSDNNADFTVFRSSNGFWYEHLPIFGQNFGWGVAGDIPLYADVDGRGYESPIVFRPSTGFWYIKSEFGGPIYINWGLNGDKPVMADYDGDGITDIAVFRPSDGTWYIRNSASLTLTAVHWGQAGDIPQPADYDGDGRTDIAVFRNGTWYIQQSTSGALRIVQFGAAGDIPVSSPVR